ncbi:MAG: hypothetical protein AAF718_18325, partial [Pseudomonadota bacterium]
FKSEIFASILWGLAAHIIMIGGILAMNVFEWLPELVYFMVLIAWSLMPGFGSPVFRKQQLGPSE